jgi:hypothetical protein
MNEHDSIGSKSTVGRDKVLRLGELATAPYITLVALTGLYHGSVPEEQEQGLEPQAAKEVRLEPWLSVKITA